MRWMITQPGGTLAAFMISPYGPWVEEPAHRLAGVLVGDGASRRPVDELVEVAEVVADLLVGERLARLQQADALDDLAEAGDVAVDDHGVDHVLEDGSASSA